MVTLLQGGLRQSRLVVICVCLFLGGACPKVVKAMPAGKRLLAGIIDGIGAGALPVAALLIDSRRKEDPPQGQE